ncbi:MAG TPA: MAE_28990/MAE_18760 family HEPN-like nuclease [Longimicrobiaceae bacterium]|nr:MAE_28990/MAE_18760 family HEPN-like nuclease [Longimicrobiaceae bacterium]
MSIRTTEQLSDALSEEIVWRKKELTALRLMVESKALSPDRRTTLLRGAVALLYAHWEGFVKAAGRAYLEFVHYQRLPYRKLARNFVALGARGILAKASETSKVRAHIDVVDFFLGSLDDRCVLPYREGINTQSNLSSRVLRDIVDTLGLDYSDFETKEKLLDELLLKQRNTIAHGEYLTTTLDAYIELYEQILIMMESFRTQVDNAAALKKYLVDTQT